MKTILQQNQNWKIKKMNRKKLKWNWKLKLLNFVLFDCAFCLSLVCLLYFGFWLFVLLRFWIEFKIESEIGICCCLCICCCCAYAYVSSSISNSSVVDVISICSGFLSMPITTFFKFRCLPLIRGCQRLRYCLPIFCVISTLQRIFHVCLCRFFLFC